MKTDKIELHACKLFVLFSCVQVHVACCNVLNDQLIIRSGTVEALFNIKLILVCFR